MIDPKNYGVNSLEEVLELVDSSDANAFRKLIHINGLKYSLRKVIEDNVGATLHDKDLKDLLLDLLQRFPENIDKS